MQVHDDEGVAIRIDPKPCAAVREGGGEASAGVRTGQPLSRFWDAMRERLREFALSLHPDKTRLIAFGRFAAVRRERCGLGTPETFAFLGFTIICGRSRSGGFPALVVAIGDIGRFRSGRHLAAYLGLVPKQHSSGGKDRLGTISKRGDTYARTLLAHGARAVVRWCMRARPEANEGWMGRLLQRRPVNVAVIAQANKTARIVWALLSKGEDYRRVAAAGA